MSQQNQNNIDQLDAVFSLSRALIIEVFPALRAALLKLHNDKISLFFYCDGEISEEDRESCECVGTEVVADFNQCNHLEVNVFRLDYPTPIPNTGILVYMRRELNSSYSYIKQKFIVPSRYQNNPEKSLSIRVRASVIYGLLGQISPPLRAAKVKWDTKTIDLYFYYDGEISEMDQQSAKCVRSNVVLHCPNHNIKLHISRVDYPEVIRDEAATTIYKRREQNSKKS